jgi:hypothetical protein
MVLSVHFDFACCVDCSYTNFIHVAQNQTCWATQLILWHGKVLRSEIWVMWSCVRFCRSCCPLWGWIMSCHLAVMYWIKRFDEDWWVIDGRMSVEISNCNSLGAKLCDFPYLWNLCLTELNLKTWHWLTLWTKSALYLFLGLDVPLWFMKTEQRGPSCHSHSFYNIILSFVQ